MSTELTGKAWVFGSPFRQGRDDPRYQSDRLARLATYLTRLCDAQARRIDHLQKKGRQIWDAKNWHETQSAGLQGRLVESQQLFEEQKRWAADLEQAKQYHEQHAEATQKWVAELEKAKQYHETRSRVLEVQVSAAAQEIQIQSQRCEALADVIRQIRRRGLCRWLMRSIPLPEWFAEQRHAESRERSSGSEEPCRHD